MNDNYNFVDSIDADVQALVHVINLQGADLVGAEIGVYQGSSTMTLLHNCPSIKTLHTVDAFQPYVDMMYPHRPNNMTDRLIDRARLQFYHSIKFSGMEDKVCVHEMDSDIAVNEFKDQSLDFIFLDAYISEEKTMSDIELWYPKVKRGGVFAGDDWGSRFVQIAVNNFREKNDIHHPMSTFNDNWVWIK